MLACQLTTFLDYAETLVATHYYAFHLDSYWLYSAICSSKLHVKWDRCQSLGLTTAVFCIFQPPYNGCYFNRRWKKKKNTYFITQRGWFTQMIVLCTRRQSCVVCLTMEMTRMDSLWSKDRMLLRKLTFLSFSLKKKKDPVAFYAGFYCGVLWWSTVCEGSGGICPIGMPWQTFGRMYSYLWVFISYDIQYIYFIYLFILRIYFCRYEIK